MTIHTHTADTAVSPAPDKSETASAARQRMKRGRQLVVTGFVVAVAGVVAYCLVSFSAGVSQELGSVLLRTPGWVVGPALGIIGIGTLLWLVGSFLYLLGGLDSDPEHPEQFY